MALVVVSAVGGAALVMRKRRRSTALPPSMAVISVVSGTRVGPKAQVVIVEVAGKALLLGVTDTSVSSLGWLDGPIDAPAGEDAEPSGSSGPSRTLKILEGAEGDEPRGNDSRFRTVLDRALGDQRSVEPFVGNPGVAALIAARTEDVVRPSASRRKRRTAAVRDAEVIVPDQVAGLVRRQRGS
jgi:flagellar biogenesis protein FliO